MSNTKHTPTPDDMLAAAEWLECNEGDPDERDPMQRVADWLRKQCESAREREWARQNGIPVARLREPAIKASIHAALKAVQVQS